MFNIKRYLNATEIIIDSRFEKISNNELNKKLEPYNLKISNMNLRTLHRYAEINDFDKHGPIEIFTYNGKTYIHAKKPPKPIYLKKGKEFFPPRPPKFAKDFEKKPVLLLDLNENSIKYFWLAVLILIDILLGWFYYFLYNKLKPLISLKNEITKFSNGDLDINTKISGKDEIAQVSNEFNNAIEKIRDLNDSRKLFLRNILHELNTPITKGKIISDTLENSRKKEILQKAFLRLEYLLSEFVKLEELSSGKMDLVKKEYRIIDLIDQALDILLIDKSKLKIIADNTKIYVDYEVFSIALKNLIDNSLKYNTNGNIELIIENNYLLIKNKGEPLKKEFNQYLKPFNREYESINKGLGLGLYITNNIIQSHGFELIHLYKDNYHIFKINFS